MDEREDDQQERPSNEAESPEPMEPDQPTWTLPTPADSAPGEETPGGYRQYDYMAGGFGPGGYGPGGYASGSSGPGSSGPGGSGQGGWEPGVFEPGGYDPGSYGSPAEPGTPRRGRRLAALAAAVLIFAGAGAGAGIAYALGHNQGSTPGALASSPAGKSLTTGQIAAEVDPAVVDIDTNLGEGTGIISTPTGEIITNNHVVEGATAIRVAVLNRGTYTATVVGTDAGADVAVLQLSGVSGLPTVKFGNSSSVQIGTSVVAIGNAGGQGFPSTVTSGAVTALGRTINAGDETGASETLTGVIQTDALIQPGNSGGPLIDSSGDVIGMNTAAASTDGPTSTISFALPINRVLQVANNIEQGKSGNGIVIGAEAFLGIAGETVSLQGSGPASGAGLEYVQLGTPAARAGLESGDVIVAFNGHATPTMERLATLIHEQRAGDRATVTFENTNGGTQTVSVTLIAAPPA